MQNMKIPRGKNDLSHRRPGSMYGSVAERSKALV
jgi:hypothetical protein